LPTGSSAMETAEHREPYESRGSRTDLGAPGGESPPGDSTILRIRRSPAYRPVSAGSGHRSGCNHASHRGEVSWQKLTAGGAI